MTLILRDIIDSKTSNILIYQPKYTYSSQPGTHIDTIIEIWIHKGTRPEINCAKITPIFFHLPKNPFKNEWKKTCHIKKQ